MNLWINIALASTLRRNLSAVSLLLLSIALTCSACGSRSFPGRLESAPSWIDSDLTTWTGPLGSERGERVIYGRGAAIGHDLISERRARAEAQAVNDASQRVIERFSSVMSNDSADLVSELKQLSWVQIAFPVERFFDPVKNTQYTLVKVTRDHFTRHLAFKLRSTEDASARVIIERLIESADKLFVQP